MEIAHLSEAAPGRLNEDFVFTADGLVVVMDGVTAGPGPTGCSHDVRWLTRNLAARLAALLVGEPDLPPAEALHRAITAVCALHGGTCDLDNPDSPSTTVTVVRRRGRHLDYLALADSPLVVEGHDGRIIEVLDRRNHQLPDRPGVPNSAFRNQPDGYWVAGARPEAASHALTGTVAWSGVRRFAVMSDGASRLAEQFGWTWHRLLDTLQDGGPAQILQAVRAAERAMPTGSFRGKRHDDATVVLCTPRP
ncbi:protein phosphatase 2C domain-containing protein [Kitasatospora mediocidica]|uniref:protein phosphatase 2C domain-containing protein n=1 Tax=Kitasatospora mediocidica TaxID=58352 RepID=UPI00056D1DDF|nr:protein phosphatase 2C domain-containing protein [Kitasatospora mediocidica]